MDSSLSGLNAWLPQSEPTAEKPFKGEDGNYYENELIALISDTMPFFGIDRNIPTGAVYSTNIKSSGTPVIIYLNPKDHDALLRSR